MEKPSGDAIIFHKCSKNYDHMVYCSWIIARDRCNCYFYFGLFFALLNENFEKMTKKSGDIIILQKCAENCDNMLYYSWDMVCDGYNCYFSFWAIFCPFTPQQPKKSKFQKKKKKRKKKNAWRYHYFAHVYQKLWLGDVRLLRNGARPTDEWTDGRTNGKSDT